MKINEIISPRPDWISGDFYHGTARNNAAAFHPTRVAYFTPDLEDAHEIAREDAQVDAGTPKTVHAKLSVQNPARLPYAEMQDLHFMPERVAQLQALGHDSAIGEYENEIAVFGNRHIHIQDVLTPP